MLTVLCGDALTTLHGLPDQSVQCCVTSPPYWGLRDYGNAGQLGLEKTPEEYVAKMVAVFREVRRVLKDDGTLWLNLGDSYAGSGCGGNPEGSPWAGFMGNKGREKSAMPHLHSKQIEGGAIGRNWVKPPPGLKPKDLVGIPWMVAFALRADGWYLRQDIIWSKPNPMPESVTDRCTKSHEYLFLLTKSARYYYDAEAIQERGADSSVARLNQDTEAQTGSFRANGGAKTNGAMKAVAQHKQSAMGRNLDASSLGSNEEPLYRNRRSVWSVATQSYSDAHFATYPPALIKPCILAGSKAGDTILDPFAGSGTTGMVALELGRKAVLIELNAGYVKLIEKRCDVTPGLALA